MILLLYEDDILIVGQDKEMIVKLKGDLSRSFDMGLTQQTLRMKIVREWKNRKLWLSQEKYIERVVEHFNIISTKSISTPFTNHLKLSKKIHPITMEYAAMWLELDKLRRILCHMWLD